MFDVILFQQLTIQFFLINSPRFCSLRHPINAEHATSGITTVNGAHREQDAEMLIVYRRFTIVNLRGPFVVTHGLHSDGLHGKASLTKSVTVVDSLDGICQKYCASNILCVLLACIEATVAREGHCTFLGCKEDVNLCYS